MISILTKAFLACDAFSQVVLLVLGAMSIASWSILLGELVGLRRAAVAGRRFSAQLAATPEPRALHPGPPGSEEARGPLGRIYAAGCRRIESLGRVGPKELMDVEDSMAMAIQHEALELEMRLWVLGTIASVSPLLGLFGTVWGILLCFHDMNVHGTTSLKAVAPGLTVALVTTVVGLAVAIPALVGHNLVSSQIRLAVTRMKSFAMDFLCAVEASRAPAVAGEGSRA